MYYGIEGECARCWVRGSVHKDTWLCLSCLDELENPLYPPSDEVALDLVALYLGHGDRTSAIRVLRAYGYDRVTRRGE